MSTNESFPQESSVVRPATADEISTYVKPKNRSRRSPPPAPTANRVVFHEDEDDDPAAVVGRVAESSTLPTFAVKPFIPLVLPSATFLMKTSDQARANVDDADDSDVVCHAVQLRRTRLCPAAAGSADQLEGVGGGDLDAPDDAVSSDDDSPTPQLGRQMNLTSVRMDILLLSLTPSTPSCRRRLCHGPAG